MRFSLPPESPLPSTYTVVACDTCGFVYADTAGNAADYARHYTSFSLYEKPDATGAGTSPEDRERFAAMIDLLATHCRPDARILDVGCGNGGLLLALRQAGFHRLVGMDPSPQCVACLEASDIEGIVSTLDEIPPDIGSFDLIVLSHVLEHLLEPRSALSKLRALLSMQGLIYVETPDALHYSAQTFVPYYFFDSEHINHFECDAFGNLARLTGFEPVTVASKTIPVKGGQAYPAVYALLRRAAGVLPPQYSPCSLQHMQTYIQTSAALNSGFAQLVASIASNRPLALWGAGSFAQRFLEQPWLAGRHIVAVVDNDPKKEGQHIAGCTIRKPANGLQGLPADTLVLILIALHPQEAVQQYQQLGLPYEHLVVSA